MDTNNFYFLNSKLSSKTLQAHPLDLNITSKDEERIYGQHRLIMGDYRTTTMPVRFKQEHGKELRDILDTGAVSLYLISDMVINVFNEKNVSGWKTYPIELYDKKGNEILGYRGFSITGRCGLVDFFKSEMRLKQMVPGTLGMKWYKGLHLGLDEWDGSDIFLAKDYFGIFVTPKVKNIIERNKITNIRFTSLADFETPIVDYLG